MTGPGLSKLGIVGRFQNCEGALKGRKANICDDLARKRLKKKKEKGGERDERKADGGQYG